MTPTSSVTSSEDGVTVSDGDDKSLSYRRRSMPSKPLSPRTPPSSAGRRNSRSDRLTIGKSSGLGSSRSFFPPLNQDGSTVGPPTPLSSALQDLFVLEQAISGYGGSTDLSDGIEQLIRDQMWQQQHQQNNDPRGSPQRHDNSQTSTPVTWKTPFEIDAPRDSKCYSPRSSSPTFSTQSESLLDPGLSEEQDAWAGIDALLETTSFDDSFAFSTSDILPRSTVKAMRNNGSFRSIASSLLNDDDMTEVSDGLAVLLLKNRRGGSKKTSKFETGMPSLVEASDPDEDSDGRAAVENSGLHAGAVPMNLNGVGGGTLFDVFHWSEKDNVDETKGRKKKLNQTRKVQLSIERFSRRSSNCQSDTASLPSLNSFRDDELSTRSETSDRHSIDGKGSVVTDESRTMQKEVHRSQLPVGKRAATPKLDEIVIDTLNPANPSSFTPSIPAQGLVFDKQVDEHIRRVQAHLPTISEVHSPGKVPRKASLVEFLGMGSSHSPNSTVPVESPLDDLPSLTSFASPSTSMKPSVVVQRSSRGNDRKEDKREPKQSFSHQLMSSIKRLGGKTTNTNGSGLGGTISGTNKAGSRPPLVSRDEEKYFPPDVVTNDKSKLFSANRCLLNSGGDGVNWDAE